MHHEALLSSSSRARANQNGDFSMAALASSGGAAVRLEADARMEKHPEEKALVNDLVKPTYVLYMICLVITWLILIHALGVGMYSILAYLKSGKLVDAHCVGVCILTNSQESVQHSQPPPLMPCEQVLSIVLHLSCLVCVHSGRRASLSVVAFACARSAPCSHFTARRRAYCSLRRATSTGVRTYAHITVSGPAHGVTIHNSLIIICLTVVVAVDLMHHCGAVKVTIIS
jgi:hypothetical protein